MAELAPSTPETFLGNLSVEEAQALRTAYQQSLYAGPDAGVSYASGYNLEKESLQTHPDGRLALDLFAAGAANAPHDHLPGPVALLDSARRTGRLSERADHVIGELIGLTKDTDGNPRMDPATMAYTIDSMSASLGPEERSQIAELINIFAVGATVNIPELREQYWQQVEARLPKPPEQ